MELAESVDGLLDPSVHRVTFADVYHLIDMLVTRKRVFGLLQCFFVDISEGNCSSSLSKELCCG
jgi:hypothetical protein